MPLSACSAKTCLLATAALLLQLSRTGEGIELGDVPTFTFSCFATNSAEQATPAPPPDPPSPFPPPTPCAKPCAHGSTCTDGVCCAGLLGVPRPQCEQNHSAYAFVLGGRGGPLGKWYDPSTWPVNSTSVGNRWGAPSAEFTAAMANTTLTGEQGGFYTKFPTLAAQIGVRSSRLDTGILNITCQFKLTGRDAGQAAITIHAAMQNTDCSSCRGWTGMHGDDNGGYIGLMLGRATHTGSATIQTFAEFNRQRYWSDLDAVPTPPKIAKLFPIMDSFVPDGDITTRQDAFAAMHDKMGTNIPSGAVPPDWAGRTTGIPWGRADPGYGIEGVLGVGGEFRKGSDETHHNRADSEPCYSPNSSCTMHDYTVKNATNFGLVNKTDIARAINATFGSTGIKPGSIVASAMADEPGWILDQLWVPTDTSHIVKQRWIEYLKAQGMHTVDFGSSDWESIEPYRTHPDGTTRLPLTEKHRFYWTIRFIHWDSCRYMAEWTDALQTGAKDPNFQTYVNWYGYACIAVHKMGCFVISLQMVVIHSQEISRNNFDGRMYVSGNGPFPAGTQSAMSYDWFEWARMKGGSLLWTEDWMPDSASHRWSYYAARMRSAIALSNRTGPAQEFSGYIVVGSSGAQSGGLLQRPLTLVGSGAKLVRYYNTGPEYMFPANSYSESANASRLMAEIAKANSMIAQAEHMLWTARRPHGLTAILYPRSSEMWDQFHFDKYDQSSGGHLCLCCCVSSMVSHYIDYTVEVYSLYLALATDSNIPVDFLDEDALEEPGTLARYQLIWITQPNIPEAGAAGLAEWVRQGGALVTVAGAGVSDAFDEPSTTLSDLAGVRDAPRDRIVVMSESTINPFAPRSTPFVPNATGSCEFDPGGPKLSFTAQAVTKLTRGQTQDAGSAVDILATFTDGSSAITRNRVGSGQAIHFAWLPGLSYWFSQTQEIGNRPRDENLRAIISGIATSVVGVVPPVRASVPRIETPLLLGPEKKTAVVTLLNFQAGQPVPPVSALELNITVPFKPSSISSVEHGAVATATVAPASGGKSEWVVSLRLPLEFGDFVLLS